MAGISHTHTHTFALHGESTFNYIVYTNSKNKKLQNKRLSFFLKLQYTLFYYRTARNLHNSELNSLLFLIFQLYRLQRKQSSSEISNSEMFQLLYIGVLLFPIYEKEIIYFDSKLQSNHAYPGMCF